MRERESSQGVEDFCLSSRMKLPSSENGEECGRVGLGRKIESSVLSMLSLIL